MLPSAKNLEGKRAPDVTFRTRANDRWEDVTTNAKLRAARASVSKAA